MTTIDPRIYVNGFQPEPKRTLRTHKLWALLEDAIDDAEHMEGVMKKHPNHFGWEMRTYVQFFERAYHQDKWADAVNDLHMTLSDARDGPGYCAMCVAGACMVRRGVSQEYEVDTTAGTDDWHQAIDQMRVGDFHMAFEHLYDEAPSTSQESGLEQVCSRFLGLFAGNPHSEDLPSLCLTWDQYRELADMLKGFDL